MFLNWGAEELRNLLTKPWGLATAAMLLVLKLKVSSRRELVTVLLPLDPPRTPTAVCIFTMYS